MEFPGHLIHQLRCLYDGQEATVRIKGGETNSFHIGKGVWQGCILSPALFNVCEEGIMRRARLDETENRVRHDSRNINNLRYSDDVTLLG